MALPKPSMHKNGKTSNKSPAAPPPKMGAKPGATKVLPRPTAKSKRPPFAGY